MKFAKSFGMVGASMRLGPTKKSVSRTFGTCSVFIYTSTSFDWQWRDKDDKFHRKGEMTPQEFAAEYVDVDWRNYVCIVNDPRNAYYQTYTVDYLQNVAGAPGGLPECPQ